VVHVLMEHIAVFLDDRLDLKIIFVGLDNVLLGRMFFSGYMFSSMHNMNLCSRLMLAREL